MKNLFVLPSLSYNNIKNLFVWNERLARVTNGGQYNFVNLDIEVKYATEKIKVGINHTHQNVVNTNVEQETTYEEPVYAGYTTSVDVTGQTIYTPIAGGTKESKVLTVKDGVTNDGYNFLYLNSDVTKWYVDYNPFKKFGLHTDMRIFWGLKGRQFVQDKYPDYTYLGIHNAPSIKWNVGVHFTQNDNLKVSFIAYGLLGTKGNAINTIRWQQMAGPDQSDLYSVDLRAFAVAVSY